MNLNLTSSVKAALAIVKGIKIFYGRLLLLAIAGYFIIKILTRLYVEEAKVNTRSHLGTYTEEILVFLAGFR